GVEPDCVTRAGVEPDCVTRAGVEPDCVTRAGLESGAGTEDGMGAAEETDGSERRVVWLDNQDVKPVSGVTFSPITDLKSVCPATNLTSTIHRGNVKLTTDQDIGDTPPNTVQPDSVTPVIEHPLHRTSFRTINGKQVEFNNKMTHAILSLPTPNKYARM
ncbi:hypothetical protein DPEC_G00249040, partial [Dallia pectoralis]